MAIEFDPIFSKDSVSERAEKDEKDKKQENRKISELVPNIQILGVTPNEGAEFEVLFVGEACGKYVLSGTICGQIFANTLEIVIESFFPLFLF